MKKVANIQVIYQDPQLISHGSAEILMAFVSDFFRKKIFNLAVGHFLSYLLLDVNFFTIDSNLKF